MKRAAIYGRFPYTPAWSEKYTGTDRETEREPTTDITPT